MEGLREILFFLLSDNGMLALIRAHITFREMGIATAFGLALCFVLLRPMWMNSVLGKLEIVCVKFAKKRGMTILVASVFPILVRVLLLPVIGVPVPHTHDEFSYLLAGDTFAAGRLTNPPHPMWIYFDTFHVNQHPTYMSKYPAAQGAFLALGKIMGSPWIGVALSVGIMCGSILWALQGWLPPRWALVGGTLVILRVGIFSYWMNSYWGGAVAAIGGALVIGALPRIRRTWQTKYAVVLGLGVAILMNSRPFEGLIFCIPISLYLAYLSCRRATLGLAIRQLVLPAGFVIAASLLFMGYYNWRGTGDPLLMPYTVNSRTYWSLPIFLWQKPTRRLQYSNPQFESFYNVWGRNEWMANSLRSPRSLVSHAFSVAIKLGYFFLWPELCVPLLAFVLFMVDARTRFVTITAGFFLLSCMAVAWFQPHYVAPALAAFAILLTQGMRHLRQFNLNQRPVGIGLTRVVVVFAILLSPLHAHSVEFRALSRSGIESRASIESELEKLPGQHLVIVRYSPWHSPLAEWVYNRADIDQAKVVWAREIPGVGLQPLLDYFKNRQVWQVDADSSSPHLAPYRPSDGGI